MLFVFCFFLDNPGDFHDTFSGRAHKNGLLIQWYVNSIFSKAQHLQNLYQFFFFFFLDFAKYVIAYK